MKKVEAIIVPSKLAAVMKSLARYGVDEVAVSEVTDFGHERPRTARYRGSQYAMEPVPNIKLEVAVCDEYAVPITHAIMQAARPGRIGDGKVFVTPLDDIVLIGTDEEGPAAIHAVTDRFARRPAGAPVTAPWSESRSRRPR